MNMNKEFKQLLRGVKIILPVFIAAIVFALIAVTVPIIGITICGVGILYGVYKMGEE